MNGFGSGISSQKTLSGGFETGIILEKSVVSNGIQFYLDAGHNGSYPGSGNKWFDISGNGKVATLYNSPTYSNTNGGIITFANTLCQYAETTTNLGDMPKWTVETWANLNTVLGNGVNAFVTNVYGGAGVINYSLGACNPSNSNSTAGIYIDSAWRLPTTGQALSTGIWYHLVGTYDGNTIRFYVNAQLNDTVSYSSTISSGGNTRIARRWDASDVDPANFIDGVIPIVRIYNRDFTQAEVAQNFNQSRGRYGV